jgi:predicted pyridoxine 5'-phosphate oxidase superfamily flavin-nucleotide-binding protein
MKLKESVVDAIMNADAKALATCNIDEVNVVPVSTVRVVDDTIWLMNYFMGKTLENVYRNPRAALACWKGLQGIKVQGNVTVHADGALFVEAVAFVAAVAPTRVLKSVLVLTPTAIYDVTPEKEKAGQPIW